MICAVHALLGGAIGACARRRSTAFLAGVGSHLLADLLPHCDYPVKVEVPMALGAVAAVGLIAGTRSTAFAGAVGGAAPDLENLGNQPKYFPTHRDARHGTRTKKVWPQVLLAAGCCGLILWKRLSAVNH